MLHVAPRLAAVALAALALGAPLRPLPPTVARPVARATVSDTVVRYRLEDQFGRVHTPATYAGAPMFIIGADQGGRATARAWALALTAELGAGAGAGAGGPRITVLPVADLRRVPRLLRRLVRGRFPREKGEQVLLDWEGSLARAYAFTPDACTVVLVGPTGQVVRRATTAVMDSAMVREFARLAVSSSAPGR